MDPGSCEPTSASVGSCRDLEPKQGEPTQTSNGFWG